MVKTKGQKPLGIIERFRLLLQYGNVLVNNVVSLYVEGDLVMSPPLRVTAVRLVSPGLVREPRKVASP